jgi:hypothetical protein
MATSLSVTHFPIFDPSVHTVVGKTQNISGLTNESVHISAHLWGHMVYLSPIQQ